MKAFRSIRTRDRRGATTAAFVFSALILSGCAAGDYPLSGGTADDSEILVDHGLDGLEARELVETLDAMPLDDRPEILTTSINAEMITFADQHEHTAEVPLPVDEIYVSVAPYRSQTHDCYYHSPTGCLGELRNTDVSVTVTDTATGEAIIDEDMRTLDNGFVGIWLPRGIEMTISITHDGQTSTSELSTFGDDAQTCLTTMRLT